MKQQSQSNGQSLLFPNPGLFKTWALNTLTPSSTRPVYPSLLNLPPSPSSTHVLESPENFSSKTDLFPRPEDAQTEDAEPPCCSSRRRLLAAAFCSASLCFSCLSCFFLAENKLSISSIPVLFLFLSSWVALPASFLPSAGLQLLFGCGMLL